MLKINQPANQIRLTNVAVVRLRQKGQRFEIACFPNKVRDWRSGVEKDVREVLQSHRIFVNVSKGEFARDVDLDLCFGTHDVDNISTIILNKGDVQLSAKERQLARDGFIKEVCSLTAERLISIKTGLPLTPAMVENTAKQLRVLPKFKEGITSKAACARLIAKLTSKLPQEIARALLRADIIYDPSLVIDVGPRLIKLFAAQIISEGECREVSSSTAAGSTDDKPKSKISFRVSTAEYQRLCDFVSNTLGSDAELIVISMLDKSVAVAPTKVEVEQSSSDSDSAADARSEGSEESEVVEEEEKEASSSSSSDEGELLSESETETQQIRNRKGISFSALMSSEDDDEDDDESGTKGEGGTTKTTDDVVDQQKKKVDELKALLDQEVITSKPEKDARRQRKVVLDEDTWSKRQQKKKAERREKEKDRKKAEEEALAKQKAKEEESERRAEAERKREANATKIILDGGPGWCVDCQINYIEELGQDVRQHYRMEWHTFNAKRRLRDKLPVSRKEYEELSRDVKEGFLAVTF